MLQLPEFNALKTLFPDGRLLFVTRMVRLFAYGALSVILALYLAKIGLDEQQIGLLLAGTMLGDTLISLWITSRADRIGRRIMLIVGAGLMILAGFTLGLTDNLILISLVAIIGTISPTGNEVGPFLSIEQAALPQTTQNQHRTQVFAWYNLLGSFSTALGALAAGGLIALVRELGENSITGYRLVAIGYGILGILLALIFNRLSPAIEVPPRADLDETIKRRFGLHRSRNVVLKLSALFMLDAFGGGFVIQSLLAYWFSKKYDVDPEVLGGIFFAANIFAGLSALAAARMAARFGLINTMVWTHIPSNVLLILVPLMPNLPLAIGVLLARFAISQMDVPTRQSYTMAVVDPDERSAAAGFTSIARTAASSVSPVLTGMLFQASLFSVPFFISGSVKILYDLALYRNFRALKPPEENAPTEAKSPA